MRLLRAFVLFSTKVESFDEGGPTQEERDSLATIANTQQDELLRIFLQFEAILTFDGFKEARFKRKMSQHRFRQHRQALRAASIVKRQFHKYTPLWMRENFLTLDFSRENAREIVRLLGMTIQTIHTAFPYYEAVCESNEHLKSILEVLPDLIEPCVAFTADDFVDPARFRLYQEFSIQYGAFMLATV